MQKIYDIPDWIDSEDFLKKIAIKRGKLKKGGELCIQTAAKSVLMDWSRGEITFFNLPPESDEKEDPNENKKINLLEYLNKVTIASL